MSDVEPAPAAEALLDKPLPPRGRGRKLRAALERHGWIVQGTDPEAV
jgi:hypothetical protein